MRALLATPSIVRPKAADRNLPPMQPTQDLNVKSTTPLISPRRLWIDHPLSDKAMETVIAGRETIRKVLDGEDRRLLAIAGPCSIHDERSALEYAGRLAELAREVSDELVVAMRVYFEKPRTTVGWKGLINDPHLNDTFDIATGLRLARRILLSINEMGLPAACEVLEPITPQYISDLIAWASIGARTTESPTHRQMASGLSMPVGYKNGTDGELQTAIDAMLSARTPHSFLGIDHDGMTCVVHTKGNPSGHLILRGGRGGPNYFAENLEDALQRLRGAGLPARLMVDCSHANSNKNPAEQATVWRAVLRQRLEEGREGIVGMMLESHLEAGKQTPTGDPSKLRYGMSITDGCMGWDETASLLRETRAALAADRKRRAAAAEAVANHV